MAAVLVLVAAKQSQKTELQVLWRTQEPPDFSLHESGVYLRPGGGCYRVDGSMVLNIYDAAGKLLKRRELPAKSYFQRGLLDEHGNLYLGCHGQSVVFAYDPDGRELWQCKTPVPYHENSIFGRSPRCFLAMLKSGELYAVSSADSLVVLSLDGKIKRSVNLGLGPLGLGGFTPAPDGGYYATLYHDNPVAFERIRVTPDDQVQWRLPAQGRTDNNYFCAPDGTFFSTPFSDYFIAQNPDGTERWRYRDPSHSASNASGPYTFSMEAGGTVYIASAQRLAAFTADGTKLWDRALGCKRTYGQPFIDGDRLYQQVRLEGMDKMVNDGIHFINRTVAPLIRDVKAEDPRLLYVLDKRTGRKLKRLALPENFELLAGPGPQHEFYGSAEIDKQAGRNQATDFMCVRIP